MIGRKHDYAHAVVPIKEVVSGDKFLRDRHRQRVAPVGFRTGVSDFQPSAKKTQNKKRTATSVCVLFRTVELDDGERAIQGNEDALPTLRTVIRVRHPFKNVDLYRWRLRLRVSRAPELWNSDWAFKSDTLHPVPAKLELLRRAKSSTSQDKPHYCIE